MVPEIGIAVAFVIVTVDDFSQFSRLPTPVVEVVEGSFVLVVLEGPVLLVVEPGKEGTRE